MLGTLAYFVSPNLRMVTTANNHSAFTNNVSLGRQPESTPAWTDPMELEIITISNDLESFLERTQILQSTYANSNYRELSNVSQKTME